ncbi:unnamed protein product [Notodromas monacha]|uniref:Anoctamin n=1 Tax=Notodromas monacha TaxID=399045 RepID=A0A7R9GF17_9CRUS|nr:unnamed protein product [Notodromas monacha]CAG0920337.1 unnamed protein product [Notodromas monacha]
MELRDNLQKRLRGNSVAGTSFNEKDFERLTANYLTGNGMFQMMRRSCAEMPDPNHLHPLQPSYYPHVRSISASDLSRSESRRWSGERSDTSEDLGFVNNSSREDLIPRQQQQQPRWQHHHQQQQQQHPHLPTFAFSEMTNMSDPNAETFFGLNKAKGDTSGPPQVQRTTYKTESLFFIDGIREIDFVLAYKDYRYDTDEEMKAEEQRIFEKNIKDAGLQIERVDKRYSKDGKTYFIKIHAPWDVLTRYAEVLNIRMPIKVKQKIKYIIKHSEETYSSAQRSYIVYQILRRARFAKIDETDEDNHMKFGIRRLIGNGTYDAAFPLHDGPFDKDGPNGHKSERRKKQAATREHAETRHRVRQLLKSTKSHKLNTCPPFLLSSPPSSSSSSAFFSGSAKKVLFEEWARVKKWFKKQPLWVVRRYFGDQIGLYFTWLGFYTRMLIPAAILGFFTFIFGICFIYSGESIPSQEICDEKAAGNLKMCPLCDKACDYWDLKSSCTVSTITYLFDNPITVFFSIFMSFWATMFIELWKRKSAIVQWEWDLEGMEEEEEARPEFEAEVKTRRLNPLTQSMEPFLPRWQKIARMMTVYSIVLFLLTLVIASVFGTIVYRLTFVAVIQSLSDENHNTFFAKNAKTIASMSGAVLNLIVIVILNYIYQFIATRLTNMEYPRTQTQFEDSYTMKMFLFQFINYYSSLVYIAFFKGKFADHPGSVQSRESYTYDLCDPAGCLFELCIQLAIIMIGKQALNNFTEVMLPYLKSLWRRCTQTEVEDVDFKNKQSIRWEEDYELQSLDRMALFEEYLEMVIQYGFVTLFVAAFPLAPFFAVINNIVELRLDAFKYVSQFRRPLAKRAEGIGAWFGILKVVTYLAVTCNAFVIAYTSDFIPRKVYEYVYSRDGSLKGYVNASLAVFDTNHFPNSSRTNEKPPAFCRYKAFRSPPTTWSWALNGTVPGVTTPSVGSQYDLTLMYWHVFAARLCFVIVFEHLIFSLTYLMSSLIPDVPVDLKIQLQREASAAREALFDGERQYFNNRPRSRASSTDSHMAASDLTLGAQMAATADASRQDSSHQHKKQRPLSNSGLVGIAGTQAKNRDASSAPAFLVEEDGNQV